MPDREKLIELIANCDYIDASVDGDKYSIAFDLGILADHLLANGVTVQQMTPITEEVPSEECLAVNGCGDYMVGKIVKDPYSTVTGYACMVSAAGIDVGIEDVTHWQPLPEAAKTRKGQADV